MEPLFHQFLFAVLDVHALLGCGGKATALKVVDFWGILCCCSGYAMDSSCLCK